MAVMRCPRCGSPMEIDSHRKMDLPMCYRCGYIEGRRIEPDEVDPKTGFVTNFQHIKNMNFNEFVAFFSKGMNIDQDELADWLGNEFEA